jgi:hypothetical protein
MRNKKRNTLSTLKVDASTVPQQPLESCKRRTLSGWPMILGWLAMLIFACHASTHMVGAGDTWVAMACGRHFVNRAKALKTVLPFHVDTIEPFSANSHKAGPTPEEVETWPKWARWLTDKVGLETVKKWHPTGWINQNWLTHVIFYSLIPQSTYEDGLSFPSNALVYLKFAIYILAVICVYYTGRLLGAHPALCAVFACFAMFIGRSFLDVRPAGFSNLLVAVFLLILVLTTHRNVLYIWLIVPLTVFWCNVHGGYIYAFIVLVPFVIWHLLMLLPKKWKVSAFCILVWVGLYTMAYKFLNRPPFTPVPPTADWFFWLLLVLVATSFATAAYKQVKNETFYAYHIVTSSIVFVCLFFARYFPLIPINLHPQHRKILNIYVSGSRFAFIAAFILASGLALAVMFLKNKLVCIKLKGIYHTIAAGFATFLAVILFNPLHLTNLTHTFVISVSKHAEKWREVNEWHRAFEWSNPVGQEEPFLIMYIMAWLLLAIWVLVILISTSRFFSRLPKRKAKSIDGYQWPRIEIALMIIASLTIYMAICSRRFIPIAAIAACPIMAMFIDQMICSITARSNLYKKNRLFVSPMSKTLQWICTGLGILAVLVFGIGWGLKFKRVYLNPWPTDTKLNSVFMRMTASDAKPFYALKFIKDNRLEGKMFNYWTEGGFIAWGQQPDPNTGRTPLQLFMDGRAQAAYQRRAYDLWSEIISGGKVVRDAKIMRRTFTNLSTKEYTEIGQWANKQLKEHDVWVVLMPSAAYTEPRKTSYHFVKGLEHNPDWPMVFYNNRQKIFVDVRTTRGRELFDGIFNGNTKYPDEFSKNLTIAHNLFWFSGSDKVKRKQALDYAMRAFELSPSQTPMQEIVYVGSRFAELRPRIKVFCENYFNDFTENKDTYVKEHGYFHKIVAALNAGSYLRAIAKKQKDTRLVQSYDARMNEYKSEQIRLLRRKRW